jgi:predicted RNase H-like HicB family nuclease
MIEPTMAAKSQGIFTLSLPCRIHKEGKHFVSWCYPLDVYSQGETQEKALRNLEEAVGLFITSCLRRGTLDRVLRDCGFVLS